ncbi:cell division protein ZipA [Alloalcanivorax profundimaris]|uniref:cell division protein ZipA n=1 Tax=Alloalcanivorax profundimaris TaxID=2735259 RepID=UPI001888FBA5|nr:cell division protein ZipA [Alloalcanivorax profundimaris]MBF1801151.1 cell division protein ZipA [Alloalcanivorax profundimaris]
MGLNLETLIGILVILILLILADGVRRMIRERHGRLRMRIDRRFGKGKGDDNNDEDEYPHDLGKPRVRRRGEASFDMDGVDDPLDRADPPMMMDPAETPPEEGAARRAEQGSLFDGEGEAGDPAPRAAEPPPRVEPEPPAPEPEPEPEPRPEPEPLQPSRAADDPGRSGSGRETPEAPPEPPRARNNHAPAQDAPPLEVIVFHLIARRPDRFDGQALLRLLLEGGLRYGDMQIFHRHRDSNAGDQLEFSVANAVEPGTFDIDTMEEEGFAGITFFMKLPGPGEPLAALDRMLAIGRRLADELDGELKDEQHSVLTPQTMEHLRQRVQEFERRQRVSHGA